MQRKGKSLRSYFILLKDEMFISEITLGEEAKNAPWNGL